MSDDKMNRGEPDRSRINLNEDYEVNYWSERFGIPRSSSRRQSRRSATLTGRYRAACRQARVMSCNPTTPMLISRR